MLFAFALYAGLDLTSDPTLATAARGASFVLALVAVIYGGSEFFRRSWVSLQMAIRSRHARSMHMDTPISLGILVGFGHSAWATLTGRGDVWFDSITVLIAALLTARWLQVRSRRLAGDASERLLSLLPSMARRVLPSGETAVVRLDDVKPDDLIEVPAGDVIPVDGRIATGSSMINNAVLTGESRPEPVTPGDIVEAGATNLSRVLQVRALAAGEHTRIGKLLTWIRTREDKQASAVLLADRLSGERVSSAWRALPCSASRSALWRQSWRASKPSRSTISPRWRRSSTHRTSRPFCVSARNDNQKTERSRAKK
jgi:Cu2+-exporting ATPase